MGGDIVETLVILHSVKGGRWGVGGNSSLGEGWEVILHMVTGGRLFFTW